MKKEKDIQGLLGNWNDLDAVNNFKGSKEHKFLDRNRTLKINMKRIKEWAPEILFNDKKQSVLDVACGNGATLEIFRYYNHEVVGMDFSPGFSKNEWLYKPLIDSQKLTCKIHDGSTLPYPFKDKEFDFLICFGAITFFKPVANWPNILNEFSRISKKSFVLGVNTGPIYDEGRKYIESWNHPNFKLTKNEGSVYKWEFFKGK